MINWTQCAGFYISLTLNTLIKQNPDAIIVDTVLPSHIYSIEMIRGQVIAFNHQKEDSNRKMSNLRPILKFKFIC